MPRLFRRQRKRRKLDCIPGKTHPSSGLNAFERCYFSQNGEDGIIAEIFRRIGTTNRFSVEIGVEDGRECNTALLLRDEGWSGVLVEGSPQRFERLRRRFSRFHGVHPINAYVDVENVAELLTQAGVPERFDLLSVDTDGNDWWLLRELLSRFRPRVVIAEVNPFYPPPARWVMPYDPAHRWDDTTYFGASLCSMVDLHHEHGYAFVALDCNITNAFFVDRDEFPKIELPEAVPEEVYHFSPSFPGRKFGYTRS
ncbi:MAG TPA: hypothetical protein VGD50_08235 [Candidatus Baltobacteraceae bacterium]